MINNFVDDVGKVYDLLLVGKNDFLKSYSYLTDAEYIETCRIIASSLACTERNHQGVDAFDIYNNNK